VIGRRRRKTEQERGAMRRIGMRRLGLMFGMLGLMAGCAGVERPEPRAWRGPNMAEPAWQAAMVMLPGDPAPRRLVEAAPELAARGAARRLGVVLYAHGCRGFDTEAIETMRLLALNGFAVVAPDHHARPDATGPCRAAPRQALGMVRPTRRDPGLARPMQADLPEIADPAYAQNRIEEVELALARLRAQPWADPARLYLVGESLGRGTAALWPTGGLAAAAVLGQDCRPAGFGPGREMPLVVPVLPLGGGAAERIRARHCGEFATLPEGGLVIGVGYSGAPLRGETGAALLGWLRAGQRRG
jgi:dienelactone hydrolase